MNIHPMSNACLLTRSLPVFLTEASTVSLSQGIRVFRSMSSQEIPSCRYISLNVRRCGDQHKLEIHKKPQREVTTGSRQLTLWTS